MEPICMNTPVLQTANSRKRNNISKFDDAIISGEYPLGPKAPIEKENNEKLRKKNSCLMKLGKNSMRKLREKNEVPSEQNPTTSLSFVGISRRVRF